MKKTENGKKISVRQIFDNNFYMLKLVWDAAPGRVVFDFIRSVLGSFGWIFGSVIYTKLVLDALLNKSGLSSVIIISVISALLWLFLDFLGGFYDSYYRPVTDIKITQHVNLKLFRKAAEVELACYENTEFYQRYTRAADEAQNRATQVLDNLTGFIGSAISLVTFAATVIALDPVCLLFVLIPLLTQFIFVPKFNKAAYDKTMANTKPERMKNYASRITYLGEYAPEIRMTGIFSVLTRHYADGVQELIKNAKEYGPRIAFYRTFREVCMRIIPNPLLMTYAGAKEMLWHGISIPNMVVLVNASGSLGWAMNNFGGIFSSMQEQSLYISNLRAFVDYEPKLSNNKDGAIPRSGKALAESDAPLLQLDNVSFKYDGCDTDILHNISLNIRSGEKIALVGHNGAGKTTLIKLLLRFYDPTGGSINYNGLDIKEYSLKKYRALFGTVFQDFHVLSMSVAENVLMRDVTDDDISPVEESLKSGGVFDRIAREQGGVNCTLTREFDDNGLVLSGGETQKIAIARGYAANADVMIFDEPSSALDPIAEYEMFENLLKLCEDKTVIFISHRLSSAVFVDRIYLLERGEVIEQGTHAELMKRDGKYADMFIKQASRYNEEATA